MEALNVATREEWLRARTELLAREKQFTRERDALSAARRALPAVKVEKEYVFEGPNGKVSLRDLCDRRQLIVYHFMFDPQWEEGCKSCSLISDTFDGAIAHLKARDTSFVVISRAPLQKLEAFRKRMGWTFPWYSSQGNDFNYDFHVSIQPDAPMAEVNFQIVPTNRLPARELPGISVFIQSDGDILHTYSAYGRGLDMLINTYNFLDLTPLGRHEEGLPWPMAWVNHHDRY